MNQNMCVCVHIHYSAFDPYRSTLQSISIYHIVKNCQLQVVQNVRKMTHFRCNERELGLTALWRKFMGKSILPSCEMQRTGDEITRCRVVHEWISFNNVINIQN